MYPGRRCNKGSTTIASVYTFDHLTEDSGPGKNVAHDMRDVKI